MRYLEDMLSKGGFGDGTNMPDGIEQYRELYIRTFNILAARYKCNQRAAASDRPGMHNSCFIIFADADALHQNGLSDEDLVDPAKIASHNAVDWKQYPAEEMRAVLHLADEFEQDISEALVVHITLDQELLAKNLDMLAPDLDALYQENYGDNT